MTRGEAIAEQHGTIHTIAGHGYFTVGHEASDGVVPLSSAVYAAAERELLATAT